MGDTAQGALFSSNWSEAAVCVLLKGTPAEKLQDPKVTFVFLKF